MYGFLSMKQCKSCAELLDFSGYKILENFKSVLPRNMWVKCSVIILCIVPMEQKQIYMSFSTECVPIQ